MCVAAHPTLKYPLFSPLQDALWITKTRGAQSGDFEFYDYGLFELEVEEFRDPSKPFELELSVGVPIPGEFDIVLSMYVVW